MIDNEKLKLVHDFIKEKDTTSWLDCLSAAKLSPVELDEILSELERDGKVKIKDRVAPTITYIG